MTSIDLINQNVSTMLLFAQVAVTETMYDTTKADMHQ